MSKEAHFIRECLHTYFGNANPGKLYSLFLKVNTKKLDILLQTQNLYGLFYYLYCNENFTDLDIPQPMIDIWKNTAWKSTFDNSLNDIATAEVAREFDNKNINYAYIKGAACRKYYKNDYIRSSVDIDIFVNRNDYPRIKAIMTEMGYSIPFDHYKSLGMKLTFEEYEEITQDINFVKKTGNFHSILDFQWDFIGFSEKSFFYKIYNINSLFLTNNTDRLELNNYAIKVLPPEKELYIMVFHYAFHHGFRGFKWLFDICTYIAGSGIEFTDMVAGLSPDSKKLIGISTMLAKKFSGSPKLSKSEKETMCVDRLLLFEYAFYKSMIYKTHKGVMSSITDRLVRIMLPYRHRSKFKAFAYMFFNSSSISHRIDSGKKGRSLLLPFSLLKIAVIDIFRKRRKPDGKAK